MTFSKTVLTLISGLGLAATLQGCGDAAGTQDGTKTKPAVQTSSPKYDLSKPAAFSLNKDCSTNDVIINSYPNSWIGQDSEMCEIFTATAQEPIWYFTAGSICTLDGNISDTAADFKVTLTNTGGAQYLMKQTDSTPDKALTLCDDNYADAPIMWSAQSEPNNPDDYDFEQSYRNYCDDMSCVGGLKHFQKYSDYSADVLAPLNLTTDIKATWLGHALKTAYGGKVSQSSFNNKNHPTDHILTFHLMPQGNPDLHEYVLYVRADGDGGRAKIKDWGGRVKCAPARTDGAFQKTPCP